MAEDTHGMGIPLPADSTPIHQYPGIARLMGEKIAEILAGGIMPEGMATVAAEQIKKAIANADLVLGDDGRLPRFGSSADALAVLVDSLSRETWIGARISDGGPTDWAMQHLTRRLGIAPATNAEYLFAVADANRNLTDLTVRASDGQFPDFVIERLRQRLGVTTAPAPARIYADAPWKPGSDIFPVKTDMTRAAGWGSSSMGDNGWRFGEMFTAKGAAFYSGGKGSEKAEQIAARMGSVPALVNVAGGKIPVSGSVDVTTSNVPRSSALRAYPGTLAGVPGTLSYRDAAPTSYIFTRSGSGSVVNVPADTPFIPDAASYRDAVTLLWMGKNNLGETGGDEIAIRLTDASFDWLAPQQKRALVLGHFADSNTPATGLERSQLLAVNKAHRDRYGALFVDVYAYLTGSQVWADTGITPTAEDLEHQRIGNKPPSLSENTGHLNRAGYIAVTNLVADKMTALHWF